MRLNLNTHPQEGPPCTQTLFRTETGFQMDLGCPGQLHLALELLPLLYYSNKEIYTIYPQNNSIDRKPI